MSKLNLPVEMHEARVRQARKAFFESRREIGSFEEPAIGVVNSWKRCRSNGLHPGARGAEIGCIAPGELRELKERNAHLLAHSRGFLDTLYRQIRSSASIVILSDGNGMLLESMGDLDFVERADQVALRPGACWSEAARGTNAIGAALIEQQSIEIIGSEHFLECNGFLSCSAAPIFDAQDRLIGALDISGDFRAHQCHTVNLVGLTAQLIEKRLFEAEFAGDFVLAFHRAEASIGTLQEGLLALSPEGHVLGVNKVGGRSLGICREMLRKLDFEMLFGADFGSFVDQAARDSRWIGRLEDRHGTPLSARMRVPPGQLRQALSRSAERLPGVPASRSAVACDPARATTLSCYDGCDATLRSAAQRARRIVGKDIPLLILGESGVGKEHFAKAFHHSGPRREGPFVALNCAAIPETLFESELFGYAGGAFTGARREGHAGKFQQARGGTMFLDEIGDMPMSLQTRLLRVLQERVVVPLGGTEAVPVDFSLVCATHRQLADAVRLGTFRKDLYFRIGGLSVTLPPLRERGDILELARCILAREGAADRGVKLSPDVLALFERYRWPGNIRELQNVLRVALALLDDESREIGLRQLPEQFAALAGECGGFPPGDSASASEPPLGACRAPAPSLTARQAGDQLETIELRAIERVLAESGGNVSEAARRLRISRNTLYRRLGRL